MSAGSSTPPLEPHKQAEIDSRTQGFLRGDAGKPFGWHAAPWLAWATIAHGLTELGITRPASILDVGCGTGWTTLFLAEGGLRATGIDLVPGNIEAGRVRAQRWGSAAAFREADMDDLDLGETFDHALVYDALHHSTRQAQVVAGLARHVAPGGWIVFGEPSWLHAISPHARQTSRELGWTERGVRIGALKRDCRHAGLTELRRFYPPSAPYASRRRALPWQVVRLLASAAGAAPQMSNWIAARVPAA